MRDRLIPIINDLADLALAGWGDPASLPTSDELGHRRPADVPLLAWRARRMGLPALNARPGVSAEAPEVKLWRSLAEAGAIDAQHASTRGIAPFLDPSLAGSMGGVEVWTESELASLHALSWGAIVSHDAPRLRSVLDHARWHIEHTQPDTATNRPWSIHLFLVLGQLDADSAHESRLYAQTLAHNCRVALGRPDVISAQILFDAADAIGAALDSGLLD